LVVDDGRCEVHFIEAFSNGILANHAIVIEIETTVFLGTDEALVVFNATTNCKGLATIKGIGLEEALVSLTLSSDELMEELSIE